MGHPASCHSVCHAKMHRQFAWLNQSDPTGPAEIDKPLWPSILNVLRSGKQSSAAMPSPRSSIWLDAPELAIPDPPSLHYDSSDLWLCYAMVHTSARSYAIVQFTDVIDHRLSPINDEGLGSHPYAKVGLQFYAFNEITVRRRLLSGLPCEHGIGLSPSRTTHWTWSPVAQRLWRETSRLAVRHWL